MGNFSIIIKSRAKHGMLFRWIRENNLTIEDASKKIGISSRTLMSIIHFRWNPYGKGNSSRIRQEVIKKLEKYFNSDIREIYPVELAESISNNKEIAKLLQEDVIQEKEIDLEYLPFYQLPQISCEIDTDIDKIDVIDKVLNNLTKKERKVLELRFGFLAISKNIQLNLSNRHVVRNEYTLEEIGEEMGISRERVRQIEAKALRKLKHPRNKILLKEIVPQSWLERR